MKEMRVGSDKKSVIDDLTEIIVKGEKEVRSLMSLEDPNSHQQTRIRELLTEMGKKGNYLKTISGEKEVDFFKYC